MNQCPKTRTPGRWDVPGRYPHLTLLLVGGVLLTGCSRSAVDAPGPAVEAREIVTVPAALTLPAGGEGYLYAQANDLAGQPIGGAKFKFHAAEPALLRVTDQGLVTSTGRATALTHVIVASGRREQAVPVSVEAGPAQRIEKLSGDAQRALAGEPLAEPLSVRLVDAWSNPLANVTMVARDSADLVAPIEVATGTDGVAQISMPPITRAGTIVLRVGTAGATSPVESFQVEVLAGPPAEIRLMPAPVADPALAGAERAFIVAVVDAFGNPVPDVELSARIANGDAGPTLLRTDAAGNASLPVPELPKSRRSTLVVESQGTPVIRATLDVGSSRQKAARTTR